MEGVRDLLLMDPDVRVAGVELLRVAVHRHLPATAEVGKHAHSHEQILLYLTGRGEQHIGSEVHEVAEGSLVVVGRRREHAFRRTTPRAPMCLVMDFKMKACSTRVMRLPVLVVREVRLILNRMSAIAPGKKGGVVGSMMGDQSLEITGWGIILLARALQQIGEGGKAKLRQEASKRLEKILQEPDGWKLPVAVLARRCSYQQDHFNRTVKSETGLTINQFRARWRLKKAEEVLLSGGRNEAAASAAGFDDVNYFTRWFRQQTGSPPAKWRKVRGG